MDISNIIKALEEESDAMYQEHLEFAEDRDWELSGCDSAEHYMDTVDPSGDDESNTIYEQGMREGYAHALRMVKELLTQ